VVGWTLQRFVWAMRLDIRFRLLRMKSDWYYALSKAGNCTSHASSFRMQIFW